MDVTSLADHATQTERLVVYAERGIDSIERLSRATQTVVVSTVDPMELAHLRINPSVIDMIIDALTTCELEEHLFRALDEFRRDETVELVHARSVEVPQTERCGFVDLVGTVNGRLALLLGEPHHDSWCQHADVGRVLVYQRLRFTTTPIRLPNCPTTAVFGPHNQLIVGTVAGEVFLCDENGEFLWHSVELHQRSLTAFRWLRRDILLSCGLDGYVVLSSLRTSSLEPLRHVTITLADLPRAARPANVNSLTRCVGIVDAVISNNEEVFLVGETGAIWSLDSREMSVHSLGRESDGVENACYAFSDKTNRQNAVGNDFLVLRMLSGSLKLRLLNKSFPSSELLLSENEYRVTTFVVNQTSNLLVCALDIGELVGVDLSTRKVVLRHPTKHITLGMAMCGNTLVLLDAEYKLHFYNFSTEL